jgi:hypothetical protein
MAFFVAKKDQSSIQDGGNYINKSGIYPVTIKTVSVVVNNKGARSLNFNVDYKGSNEVFYGLKLDNNDGSENFEAKIFNKLVVIAGLDVVSDPEIQEHLLGKDRIPTDLAVLTDFTDLPVKIRVQFEYSKYNGEIKERRLIKAFYREDGASAAEIINGTQPGVQLSKDMAYAENVTYRDGLTAEEVAAWKAAKKSGGATPAPKATPAANPFAAAASFPA